MEAKWSWSDKVLLGNTNSRSYTLPIPIVNCVCVCTFMEFIHDPPLFLCLVSFLSHFGESWNLCSL